MFPASERLRSGHKTKERVNVYMKMNRNRYELALARSCMTPSELCEKAQMPRPSLYGAIQEKSIRPATLGKIARALDVDVTEIMELEE